MIWPAEILLPETLKRLEIVFLPQLCGSNNEYCGQIYTVRECWKGHCDPMAAVGVELGLCGMHLAMSLLFWITFHRTLHSQTQIPSYLKEDEDGKHFGPSQKENSFSIWNWCCWKLFLLFAARCMASSASLHLSGTCRQLFQLSYGEISSYMLFEHFFSLSW